MHLGNSLGIDEGTMISYFATIKDDGFSPCMYPNQSRVAS